MLRGWSGNPLFVAAPAGDTDYLVEARCSSYPSCLGSAVVDVSVACPSSETLGQPFPETILAPTKSSFSWTTPLEFDLFGGALADVSVYVGSLTSGSGSTFSSGPDPLPGQGVYFVVRETGQFCNDRGLWTTGGTGESPLREPSLP